MRTRTDYTQLWDQMYGGKPLLALMWGASGFRVRYGLVCVMTFVTEKYSVKTTVYGIRKGLIHTSSGCTIEVRNRDDRTLYAPLLPVFYVYSDHIKFLERVLGKSLTF